MDKCLLDGEALWNSDKIACVEPEWVRPEYAWLRARCGVNAVFELNVRAIWARCYSYNRPGITIEIVAEILESLERARLLFAWGGDDRRFGYWTGADKPGRIARLSWREREKKRGNLLPDPPKELLQKFLAEPSARIERASGTPLPCSEHAESVLALSLSCPVLSVSGENHSSEAKSASDTLKGAPKPSSREAEELAQQLRTWILRNNPQHKISGSQMPEWAREIDRMIRIDHRSPDQIRAVIDFALQSPFWHKNILSAGKLRQQFDRLTLEKHSNENGGANGNDRGSRKPSGAVTPEAGKYSERPHEDYAG